VSSMWMMLTVKTEGPRDEFQKFQICLGLENGRMDASSRLKSAYEEGLFMAFREET
jgi:hypothetical protein